MQPSGNTILITGGGSGIGAALAHRLHDAGNTVLIAGRRQEALQKTAAGRAGLVPVHLDVDDVQNLDAFAANLIKEHPALNILINNAGIMKRENLGVKRDLTDAHDTIMTNLMGPIRVTNAFIEHLSSQKNAVIMNVTSGLAFVPMRASATYSATKAALHSYTLSLREALKGKVEVIEIAPPGVQTSLTPGQETRDGYMPLEAFADEVMSLLSRTPTPPEILVERVHFLRFAEKEGRMHEALTMLSAIE
ncbi:MAG: oxidoreductase [Candidatus Puniceispirillum sp.]|nr:oxidoreductase [Candidatus Puniceispirillum sp.]